jgi:hypothetical protein
LASLVAASAAAEYNPQVTEMFARHARQDYGFGKVPILNRNVTTTRDQSIRTLVRFVDSALNGSKAAQPIIDDCTAGVTAGHQGACTKVTSAPSANTYDPELVIAERHRMLEELGTPLPENFNRISEVDGLQIIESEEGTAIIRENVFTLRVFTEGHAFKFWNYEAAFARNNNKEARLTPEQGEIAARDLIAQWQLLPEADLNQLTFFKTRYAHFTGNGQDPGDRAVGTSVYFGRTIDGVPVVSESGSHISIGFGANRVVEHVSFDWSPLERGEGTQTPVDGATFRTRLKGKLGTYAIENSHLPGSYEILRTYCGYMDFGTAFGKMDQLQLGCEVQYRAAGNNKPQIMSLPLGDKVVTQNGWSDADVVREYERIGSDPSKAAELVGMPELSSQAAHASQALTDQSHANGCSVGRLEASGGALSLAYLGLGAVAVLRRRRNRA